MRKKTLSMEIIGMMAVSLCACGGKKESPVYIAVSPIINETSKTIADGLVLQSRKDSTKVEEATF